MALKCCNLTERNSNATIKPTDKMPMVIDENPYDIIEERIDPIQPFDRVKKWLSAMTSSRKAEGSLPVSRTSSNNSCGQIQAASNDAVYRDPTTTRPVITNPILDKETTDKIERNYTLIEPCADRLQNVHLASEPTYETIQSIGETPPRYLDPADCE